MGVIKGLEWTFDTVASEYEKFRPGYVDELYREIFAYIPLNRNSKAVEVGIGAGQATLPILNTGCAVTAVEYGPQFSELCRKKFQDYPNFSVITRKFEDTIFEENAFDLIFSASAFHWIPEEIGYPKVFSMLKSGGAFARFANHPFRDMGNPALAEEIHKIYGEYYYKYHNKKQKKIQEFTEADAKNRALIAEYYGFTDIRWGLFRRTRRFSAGEYVKLLGTYSDHIVIEEGIRNEFFQKIEAAIEDHGGFMTIYDTMDLQLARKP